MDSLLLMALQRAGIHPASAYSTGQVARVLGISAETVRRLVDAYEPDGAGLRPETGWADKGSLSGLKAIRIHTHRRIAHDALAEWLRDHDAYTVLCTAT